MNESRSITLRINGQPAQAQSEQSVAAALMQAGIKTFRQTSSGEPRGIYCGMGVCFECLVTVDGVPDQQACMLPVRPGMHIQTTPEDHEEH
jgi:predicted molibdopterin-dependent oxidoreductase YjgC